MLTYDVLYFIFMLNIEHSCFFFIWKRLIVTTYSNKFSCYIKKSENLEFIP